MNVRSKFFSYLPVGLAVALALTLTIAETRFNSDAQLFETHSLKALRTLNYQYQMTVTDLSSSAQEDSSVLMQLYQANALIPGEVQDEHKGLILSVGDSDALLLLQPQDPLPDEALLEIADAYVRGVPEIEAAELDQEIALESPLMDWNLIPVVTPDAQTVELSAEPVREVTIGVIDSGMDLEHEIFVSVPLLDGWNTISDDGVIYDDVGHGTHIAGILASKAPGVTLAPYKIVDSKGGRLSNVLEAFSKAIEDEVDVINASFGLGSSSFALENLVEKAYENGIFVVAAAGNSGKDTGFYPAGYAQTIAVGSVDSSGKKMSNSNYGTWVDVAAYGYKVRSSLPNNQYGYKSGTSQATAFVSAAVARLLQNGAEDLTLQEVLDLLSADAPSVVEGELAGTPIVQ